MYFYIKCLTGYMLTWTAWYLLVFCAEIDRTNHIKTDTIRSWTGVCFYYTATKVCFAADTVCVCVFSLWSYAGLNSTGCCSIFSDGQQRPRSGSGGAWSGKGFSSTARKIIIIVITMILIDDNNSNNWWVFKKEAWLHSY